MTDMGKLLRITYSGLHLSSSPVKTKVREKSSQQLWLIYSKRDPFQRELEKEEYAAQLAVKCCLIKSFQSLLRRSKLHHVASLLVPRALLLVARNY